VPLKAGEIIYDGFKIPLDYLEVMVTGRTLWTAQVYTN
jgi:hypothetical protein